MFVNKDVVDFNPNPKIELNNYSYGYGEALKKTNNIRILEIAEEVMREQQTNK